MHRFVWGIVLLKHLLLWPKCIWRITKQSRTNRYFKQKLHNRLSADYRRIVTFLIIAPYKYRTLTYLFTYLLKESVINAYSLQFFSGYPATGNHPLLLEWHGSAAVSRSVGDLVEGFLEGISRLLGSGGGRKSVPICHCPDDVPHCRILSPDKTEWRLISTTLCG